MERVLTVVNRVINSDAAINTILACTFGILAVRSMVQQRTIEALEAEKDSMVKVNKGMTKTIWDWKQKLYADAEANPQKALVPLSTLKPIFGEVVTPASPVLSGADDKQDKSALKGFMI